MQKFRIVYVVGARQVGKSTLVRSIADKLGITYLTFDEAATRNSAEIDPEGFIRTLDLPVVVDEFQHVPQIIPAIKLVSDRANAKGLFLLTGSADIFKSARLQEALPGHLARVEMHPLSVTELRDVDSNFVEQIVNGELTQLGYMLDRTVLADRILLGGFPEVQSMSFRARLNWFQSYLRGRLHSDFETIYAPRGDHQVRLDNLIPALAARSAKLLRYSNLSTDDGINDKVVKNYVEALELMFVVHQLPAFRKNPGTRGMPKLHFLDTGLAAFLMGFRNENQLSTSMEFGRLLETLVFNEIVRQSSWAAPASVMRINHFRDTRKREVDLIIADASNKLHGIEVKAAVTVTAGDFKGLASFAAYAGSQFASGTLLYNGERSLPFKVEDNIYWAIPLSNLLPLNR